jgi:hypothetical protein
LQTQTKREIIVPGGRDQKYLLLHLQIIGYQEFPYTGGNKLKNLSARGGKDEREVEREYWVRLGGVDKKLLGDDNLAIFHVHYKGNWHPVPQYRDRSVITQVNVRHTTKLRQKAFHIKCQDLNKWREKHGTSVLPGIPAAGWKWQEQPNVSIAMHKMLSKAEGCTKKVRSLDLTATIPRIDVYSRKALIWAVQKYQGGKVPDLPNAVNDGALLQSLLQNFGWEVDFVPNVKLEEAHESLTNFMDLVELSEDSCLFAFIGHGIEVNGKNYLVPCDAKLGERDYRGKVDDFEMDLMQKCFPFEHVTRKFAERVTQIRNKGMPTPPTIFILDCCRDNFADAGSAGVNRSIFGAQSKPESGIRCDVDNSIVIFSTTSGQTASDGKAGKGGPFMRAFTEAAEVPEVTLDDILRQTRQALELSTQDGARYQMAPSIDLLKQKFYFIPPQMMGAAGGESTPPTPISAGSAGSRASWNQSRILDQEGDKFWKEYFQESQLVEWSLFAFALQESFPFIQDDASLALILERLDVTKDGKISDVEFNIWTKMDGLEGACRKALQRKPAQAQSVKTRVEKGMCPTCCETVFDDEPRRNESGVYYHEKCRAKSKTCRTTEVTPETSPRLQTPVMALPVCVCKREHTYPNCSHTQLCVRTLAHTRTCVCMRVR